MLKKSFLTPVLSGVLALTVVGSGVLYYFDRSGEKDGGKDKTNEKGISHVSENIGDTIDLAEKAIKGELDFSYSAEAELKLGEGLTKDIGYEVKPFAVSAATKQKGKKTAADMKFKYDSKDIATLNTVYDNETETVYIKSPELSDAYLSASADDITKLMEGSGLADELKSVSPTGSSVTAMASGYAYADIFDALSEIDYGALADDMEGYWKLIVENCPEGKESGNISGDIDGNSYNYQVKTYEVTGQVMYDIMIDVTEKAKSDEVIKDLFVKMGISESDYDTVLDSMISEIEPEEEELKEVLMSVDVYYDGETAVGFSTSIEDELNVKMVSIETDEVYAVDMTMDIDNSQIFTFKGSARNDGGKVNGKFDLSVDDGSDNVGMSMTFTDLQAQGELFSGSMKYDLTVVDAGETVSPSIELVSNSTEDKLDITVNIEESGTNYLTVTVTGEETDASDITVPSDNIYSFDESGVEAYIATCKTDELEENIKNALGSDLYNDIFGGSENGDPDYNAPDIDNSDGNEGNTGINENIEGYDEYEYPELSGCEFKLNGKAIKFPLKYSEIQSGFDTDIDSLDSKQSYFLSSADSDVYANVYNISDKKIAIKDAEVTGITSYGGDEFTVEGLGCESSVADLEKAFSGVKVNDPDFSTVCVYSEESSVMFGITNGKIDYIAWYNDASNQY